LNAGPFRSVGEAVTAAALTWCGARFACPCHERPRARPGREPPGKGDDGGRGESEVSARARPPFARECGPVLDGVKGCLRGRHHRGETLDSVSTPGRGRSVAKGRRGRSAQDSGVHRKGNRGDQGIWSADSDIEPPGMKRWRNSYPFLVAGPRGGRDLPAVGRSGSKGAKCSRSDQRPLTPAGRRLWDLDDTAPPISIRPRSGQKLFGPRKAGTRRDRASWTGR